MNEIDFTSLKTRLCYDPQTGKFTWLVRVNSKVPSGSIAGNIMSTGYLHITIKGKKILAHRLAWFYTYGVWPTNQIDHINGKKLDNRINNLRDVSASENLSNRHKTGGKNPYIGVSRIKDTLLWQAHIGFDGKQKNLGRFKTAELAQIAYLDAKKIYHPTAPYLSVV
jgi:hypothetical protein